METISHITQYKICFGCLRFNANKSNHELNNLLFFTTIYQNGDFVLQTQYLCNVGGRNVPDMVRRIMRRIASNAVWSKYSLKGKAHKGESKHRFMNSKLYRCLGSRYFGKLFCNMHFTYFLGFHAIL